MTRLIVFSVAFVISGCVQAQEEADTCGSVGLQGLVGQNAMIAELLEFPDRIFRVVGQNDAVTLDYRPDRLNISIDGGRIEAIRCR